MAAGRAGPDPRVRPPADARQVAVSLGLTDVAEQPGGEGPPGPPAPAARAAAASDGGSWSPDESPADREAPDAVLEADDERHDLLRRLDRLDDRERAILALRFGLEGDAP